MGNKRIDFPVVVSVVASVLTILTPLLYLIGLGFYQGNLSSYGISSSLFPLDFQGYLTSAYYFLVYTLFNNDGLSKVIFIFFWMAIIILLVSISLYFTEIILMKTFVFIQKKLKSGLYEKEENNHEENKSNIIDLGTINNTMLIITIIIFPLAATSTPSTLN